MAQLVLVDCKTEEESSFFLAGDCLSRKHVVIYCRVLEVRLNLLLEYDEFSLHLRVYVSVLCTLWRCVSLNVS